MARNLHSRIQLCGTLVTQSPLHVGGHGEDVDTDLPLARDGAGQLYVPGTSLAGALRELAERLFGEDFIHELWGYQREDRGHASFVVVEDAVIEDSESVVVEIRDHVGIDREYGSAAEHIKYDRAILPRGTKLRFQVSVEVVDSRQRSPALAMVAALRDALQAGEVRLGAAKTRGLGQIRLENAHLTEQVFGTRQGILNSLRQPQGMAVTQEDLDTATESFPTQKRPRLTLTLRWHPVGPLMVKAGFDGIASDMLPLVSRSHGNISLVLPGSSVKGALRCQAERIVRTIRGETGPAWLGGQGREKFLEAVRVSLVNELFGQAGERMQREVQQREDNKPWLPGLGALSVVDCYGKYSIAVSRWQAIQAAENDKQLKEALAAAGLQHWSQAYHVAIDRWLGSAAESMLYTVLEPHHADWEPLTLEVNLQRLPENLQWPAIALLLLVLRDLANDRVPLGFATHRGMGKVQVMGLEIQGRDLEGDLATLSDIRLESGRLQNLPLVLKTAWQQWVTQNQEVPA